MHLLSKLAAVAALLDAAHGLSIVGVAPEDQGKYSADKFQCFDGTGPVLSATAVNDEYCDCADGSDEPGTGACAGQLTTVFYCKNEGSTPRRLYSSRVGDGICDCCDGSDEASQSGRSGTKCSNTCAEQGAREQEEGKRRIEELTQALALQAEVKSKALEERETYKKEIQRLNGELPALQESLQAFKAEADKEREAQKAQEEARKAQEEEEEAKADGSLGTCMWRQTGGCVPTGPREKDHDKKCHTHVAAGSSGYCDCNGDGVKAETEPGYACTDSPPGAGGVANCKGLCMDLAANAPKEPAKGEGEEEEKPQVSEYAKWMDGAAETLSAEEGKAAEGEKVEGEKPQVSEYTKWMEGAETAQADDTGDKEKLAAAAEEEKPAEPKPAEPAEPAKPSAIDEERTAQGKLDNNKREAKDMQDKLDALPDSHLGYASLMGKTLTKRVSEFNYKVSFFASATQDHTSLGKWAHWTGPNSGVFEHGATCWQGPERKLNVKFECGMEEALLDAYEPSRCVYEATVAHPGACHAEELELLKAGTRVIDAHEEL